MVPLASSALRPARSHMPRRLLYLLSVLSAIFALAAGDAMAVPDIDITAGPIQEPAAGQVAYMPFDITYTRNIASDPVAYTINVRTQGAGATEGVDYRPWN